MQGFIRKVNLRFRADVAQLPTEAEWECAFKAGSTTLFEGGDAVGGVSDYCWHEGNSDGETHPVAQKKANKWGLYDMGGNVFEVCLDMKREFKGAKVVDPVGPTGGVDRVVRGGSAMHNPAEASHTSRGVANIAECRKSFGFRIVMH